MNQNRRRKTYALLNGSNLEAKAFHLRHSFLYLVPKVQNDGLMFLIPFNEEVDIIRTPGELRADLEAEAIDQGVDLYNEDIEYMQQIYYSMLEQIAISRKV